VWWWDIPELVLWGIVIFGVVLAIGFIVVMATVYEAAVEAIEFFKRANAEYRSRWPGDSDA
jgi:hypothetical protein